MAGTSAMGREEQVRTRLALARGHWSLGEHEEALQNLERLVRVDPQAEGLSALIESFCADAGEEIPGEVRARLRALDAELQPAQPISLPAGSALATGTLANLLAEQGHTVEALAVAQGVLRTRPDDARARAVCERVRGADPGPLLARLERWLAEIGRLRRGEAQA